MRGKVAVSPFRWALLADTHDRLDAMRVVLTDVRDRAAAGAVWCAPLRKIALWLREQPNASARHLHLDAADTLADSEPRPHKRRSRHERDQLGVGDIAR